jgi:redox-sensing transcriptional repressor
LNRRWKVALVGAGNIGSALFAYKEFRRQGFDIAGVFDVSPDRVGQRWRDLVIHHIDDLAAVVAQEEIEIGVIAVPARAAQSVADRLVEAGVHGILNFAHRRIQVPATVAIRSVNLSIELEGVSFAIKAAATGPRRRDRADRPRVPRVARRPQLRTRPAAPTA